MSNKALITSEFKSLQDEICKEIELADGHGSFHEDLWERSGGGGGRTRVIESNVIEKGGVNFSAVSGKLPENIQKALKVSSSNFFATGVSIVMHPSNPFVPIIHMNVRYFELDSGLYWFGGGIDLTPHYINSDEARFFHQSLKTVCDKLDHSSYSKYKKWADDYFYIPHRKETRGVGGIFFDRINEKSTEFSKEQLFNFVLGVGKTFAPTYTQLINTNKNTPFTEENKEWQYLRRSRYVEFNLVYDKGTKFGLDTDGRTDSILMSMPPLAKWPYNSTPAPNSKEETTIKLLIKNHNWVD